MTEVTPGFLEQEFPAITTKISLVEPFVKWVQIDLLDGSLFNQTNFNDPTQFLNLKTKVGLELHMMVENPLRMVSSWAEAGFKRFIAHTEGLLNIDEFVSTIRNQMGLEVGLAIDLPTPAEKILPYLEKIDCLLLMSVPCGKSGQKFNNTVLEKIKTIRKSYGKIPVEIDGGVNLETGKLCIEAGAVRLVSTSYIFSRNNIKAAIEQLRKL